jgi:EAL domain-containing protein (putative c-di-GMP-specific phosphodiesterase class I)
LLPYRACGSLLHGGSFALVGLKVLADLILRPARSRRYFTNSTWSGASPEFAKLDMSLVCGIDTDSRRQSIVRSLKNMCDELGMLVIAEGAETAAERDMLTKLGCDLLQGYLFARPERGFMAPRW